MTEGRRRRTGLRMTMMKKTICLLTAICLALGAAGALAEYAYEGTVEAGDTLPVLVSFGGRVSGLTKRAGDLVAEGETLATVGTTLNYAPVEGTVTGLYIIEGDKAEDVTERYGASLYIEPTNRYTISATTDKAYNSSETHYVHLGERVYLKCAKDGSHRGTGMISALTDKGYEVEVTGGDFYMEEKVNIYRSSDYDRTTCIGQGTLGRTKPVAVKGSGSIMKVHIKNGDFVERGELLFETVEGTLDGLYAPGSQVLSPVSGIVSSVDKKNGENAAKGDSLMKILPTEGLQVVFEIQEPDLFVLQEGMKVRTELYWETERGQSYEGEITAISHLSETTQENSAEKKTYKVYASITPDERIRAGMTVVVYVDVGEKEQEAAAE